MSEDYIQPDDEAVVSVVDPEGEMPGLAGYVRSKFEDAENGRQVHEQRWLQAYKNFRGIYDSTTQYRDSERSKVFIKITKTKVLAAYGQSLTFFLPTRSFRSLQNLHLCQKVLSSSLTWQHRWIR